MSLVYEILERAKPKQIGGYQGKGIMRGALNTKRNKETFRRMGIFHIMIMVVRAQPHVLT